MSKDVAEYNSIVADLHVGHKEAEKEMADMGMDVGSEMASEVAESTLADESWMVKLFNSKGITDHVGRLADDIACGGKL